MLRSSTARSSVASNGRLDNSPDFVAANAGVFADGGVVVPFVLTPREPRHSQDGDLSMARGTWIWRVCGFQTPAIA